MTCWFCLIVQLKEAPSYEERGRIRKVLHRKQLRAPALVGTGRSSVPGAIPQSSQPSSQSRITGQAARTAGSSRVGRLGDAPASSPSRFQRSARNSEDSEEGGSQRHSRRASEETKQAPVEEPVAPRQQEPEKPAAEKPEPEPEDAAPAAEASTASQEETPQPAEEVQPAKQVETRDDSRRRRAPVEEAPATEYDLDTKEGIEMRVGQHEHKELGGPVRWRV